jgi:hypothetical protein
MWFTITFKADTLLPIKTSCLGKLCPLRTPLHSIFHPIKGRLTAFTVLGNINIYLSENIKTLSKLQAIIFI